MTKQGSHISNSMSIEETMEAVGEGVPNRKAKACNECKRRKVRCTGGNRCSNCMRDGKTCQYNTALQTLRGLQQQLHDAEKLITSIERAWTHHLPQVSLYDAVAKLEASGAEQETPSRRPSQHSALAEPPETRYGPAAEDHTDDPSPAEFSNVEDYEFDETQVFDNTTDGMGSLVTEPGKVGYTGPQSGVAALKFLQNLHLYHPADQHTTVALDERTSHSIFDASPADTSRFINDYFALYHPSYPILHEGTFRARVAGAVAKPRDGSWPLLRNIVIAIGAFVGATDSSDNDVPFYQEARRSLTMDILEKGSLSYVQGLILMANYLQKRNKPNSGFVLVGIGWSMALAIGLHREFGLPSTTPFAMEIRRRVWWTLYVLVSGAQLTLGRPPASLVGVNVRPPSNTDDADLAVEMDKLPPPKEEPTTTSCLWQQARLARIANTVQVELLTHQIPSHERAVSLDRSIDKWQRSLPPYFSDSEQHTSHGHWFEIPKRILIWRSFHLRIVLNRPVLFQRITEKKPLDTSIEPVRSCITVAEHCVESICGYLETGVEPHPRGLTWYATYWLITATFVQATCYIYEPTHPLAQTWKAHLQRAVECLLNLGATNKMALKARNILKRLLDQSDMLTLFEVPTSLPTTSQNASNQQDMFMDFWGQLTTPNQAGSSSATGLPGLDNAAQNHGRDSVANYFPQNTPDAELLDATGGVMLQSSTDFAGSYCTEYGGW